MVSMYGRYLLSVKIRVTDGIEAHKKIVNVMNYANIVDQPGRLRNSI